MKNNIYSEELKKLFNEKLPWIYRYGIIILSLVSFIVYIIMKFSATANIILHKILS